MSWNDTTIARLKELWAEGLSCSQVARALNAECGARLSRCAIAGKVSRLGLQRRGDAPRRTYTGFRNSPIKAEPPPPPVEPSPFLDAEGHHLTIRTIRDGMCRWPIGDPAQADFHFCGATCPRTETYCGYHLLKSRAPQTNPRRKGEPDELAEITRNARGLEAA